jgi:hypothetical protein
LLTFAPPYGRGRPYLREPAWLQALD